MRALPMVLVAFVGSFSGSQAASMTCATYRARLETNAGHAHAVSLDFQTSQGRQSQTNPHLSYSLTAGEGLSGTMECFEADHLREADFTADLKGLSAESAADRRQRLRALAAASACVLAPAADTCEQRTAELFARASRQLALARSRGDPLPAADETSDLSARIMLDLYETPAVMQFSLFIKDEAADE